MGLSGVFASAESGVLPLEDIAVGLSREGRFGNQTILHWTVADHLLACLRLTELLRFDRRSRLLVGLHDAHESMTRDVPTDCKTNDVRALQAKIDARLYEALGIPPTSAVEGSMVKAIDTDMLLAEASLVCPPATFERIKRDYGGRSAYLVSRQAVTWVLRKQLTDSETAAEWLRQIKELLHGRD